MAAAAALVGAALLSADSPSRPPITSVVAFTLDPVASGSPDASLSGHPGRPVVLTFFASWCVPCTRELPAVEALASKPGGPQVVGVDFMDQRVDALSLLASTHVTFPAGYDHDGSVGARWKVDGLPVTVFIDSDGHVVRYHRGELGATELGRLAGLTR